MQAKTIRAFRTITEASEELDLQPHVLRFWESKFAEIRPIKRGGGRRFYRPEDIDFLRGIKILLHNEKHPIKDVQKLIRVKGAERITELGRSIQREEEAHDISLTDLVPKRIVKKSPKKAVTEKSITSDTVLTTGLEKPSSEMEEFNALASEPKDNVAGEAVNQRIDDKEDQLSMDKVGDDDSRYHLALDGRGDSTILPLFESAQETISSNLRNVEFTTLDLGQSSPPKAPKITAQERESLETALLNLKALKAQWENFIAS